MPVIRALIFLLAGAVILRAQSPVPSDATPTTVDPRVKTLIDEARLLQQQQHSFEALKKLDEAEVILPGSAFIANVRGSIYTAPPFRDYVKALECFEAAEKLMPGAFEPKFNRIELLYVAHKYPEAEAAFTKLLTDFPKLREEIRHLVQFKVIVCQLKQGKVAEAEKASSAFTFMDDTPAYYYTKAAFAFQKNDSDEARLWVAKAGRIFKPQDNAVYLDTLMESEWLNSITSGKGTK